MNIFQIETKIVSFTAASLILIVYFVHLSHIEHNDFLIIVFSVIIVTLTALAVILSDLKKRRNAEKELNESRSLLYLTFLESPDALFLVDEGTHIIKKCSNNALKLFEFNTEEEMKGRFGPGLQKKPYSHDQVEEINKQISQNGFWKAELEFITNKGNTFWGAISVTALRMKEEDYMLTRIIDVTKKRRDRMELKEMNASKDKFFSILAHDLRSPFMGITGITEVLSEESETLPREDIAEYSKAVHAAAKKVYGLLNNLLEWSMLHMGKMKFMPVSINVTEIIRETIGLFSTNAVNKNILLAGTADSGLFCIADRNMFSTILRNLVSNAIKFTPSGGRVTISARASDEFCEIKVTDSGIGMSENTMERLFSIESKHSRYGTEGEEGSGLGLILCRELVEKNGGNITVISRVNGGTEFIFTLPAAAAVQCENSLKI